MGNVLRSVPTYIMYIFIHLSIPTSSTFPLWSSYFLPAWQDFASLQWMYVQPKLPVESQFESLYGDSEEVPGNAV